MNHFPLPGKNFQYYNEHFGIKVEKRRTPKRLMWSGGRFFDQVLWSKKRQLLRKGNRHWRQITSHYHLLAIWYCALLWSSPPTNTPRNGIGKLLAQFHRDISSTQEKERIFFSWKLTLTNCLPDPLHLCICLPFVRITQWQPGGRVGERCLAKSNGEKEKVSFRLLNLFLCTFNQLGEFGGGVVCGVFVANFARAYRWATWIIQLPLPISKTPINRDALLSN